MPRRSFASSRSSPRCLCYPGTHRPSTTPSSFDPADSRPTTRNQNPFLPPPVTSMSSRSSPAPICLRISTSSSSTLMHYPKKFDFRMPCIYRQSTSPKVTKSHRTLNPVAGLLTEPHSRPKVSTQNRRPSVNRLARSGDRPQQNGARVVSTRFQRSRGNRCFNRLNYRLCAPA